MSRLDQAFIKAYHKLDQPHTSPPSSNRAAVAPKIQAPVAIGTASERANRDHVATLTSINAFERPQEEQTSGSEWRMETSPKPPAATDGAQTSFAANSQHYSRIDTGHVGSRPCNEPHVRLGAKLAATAALQVDDSLDPSLLRAKSFQATPAVSRVAAELAVGAQSAPEANAAKPVPVSVAETRAAFEVDRFLWPDSCKNLLASAGDDYRRIANELLADGQAGKKLVLLTSLRRGEGRTSLALCLAHALAQQKACVALMEGDIGHPQLARQLKLLPSAGWDETLQAAEPVTESWIESIADGMLLVPLRNPADQRNWRVDIARLEHTVELLCRQHDVVLVDCGPLEDLASRELMSWLTGAVKSVTALVVRDVRTLSHGVLDEVQQHLTAVDISSWNVVENFV